VLFTDLLRVTVLLIGAEATALGAVAVASAGADGDTATLIVAAIWWTAAVAGGVWSGRRLLATDRVADALRSARTATVLPEVSPAQVTVNRLWPLGLFALVAGGVSWLWPQVPVIAAGYALLWSLSWRRQEAAVTAIEERDGVRFYVEPGSALQPIKLVRVPGLAREVPQVPAA
jgi:hypothetical protein